jgi:hypothetical protein
MHFSYNLDKGNESTKIKLYLQSIIETMNSAVEEDLLLLTLVTLVPSA